MRQVELKCSFKFFVQMLSYIAMEMPKTAFGQTIDYKHEKTYPSAYLPWMEKLFLFICKVVLNKKSNCKSYWMCSRKLRISF